MQSFVNAKWIWLKNEIDDSYVDFVTEFDATKDSGYVIKVSCDTDYTLFINNKFVSCNQYGDFEHYKVYDEINVDDFICKGKNIVKILAYHSGVGFSRHRVNKAGVIFEVFNNSQSICYSDENVLSRLNPCYKSGLKLKVSNQLGFTFHYDATKEGFEGGYENSFVVDKKCNFFPRPNQRLRFRGIVEPKEIIKLSPKHYLIYLGGEKVGVPLLKFNSTCVQNVTIGWGEHVTDGEVAKKLGDRTFAYTYTAKRGQNDFTNYMLRLGCRYLEAIFEVDTDIDCVSIIDQYYPVNEKKVVLDNPLDNRIYQICLNTLNKCMMEHYVDCPWREQSLYVFDSRNQILCGYYAYTDGNVEYVKSNLKLICEDSRHDNMLSICYPSSTPLAIPSFSQYFFLEMREYIDYTADTSLAEKYFSKLEAIIEEFLHREKEGLICKFSGEEFWNFYDWTDYCAGSLFERENPAPDFMINALMVMALDNFKIICDYIGQPFKYEGIADKLRQNIRKTFLRDNGLFSMSATDDEFCELVNSFAILLDISTKDEAKVIATKIINKEIVECTLSMRIFLYEALLSVDENYKDYVLDDIRSTYKVMLDSGYDTVWETQTGKDDFFGAASMCHGWSAVPIYFYHKFKMVK